MNHLHLLGVTVADGTTDTLGVGGVTVIWRCSIQEGVARVTTRRSTCRAMMEEAAETAGPLLGNQMGEVKAKVVVLTGSEDFNAHMQTRDGVKRGRPCEVKKKRPVRANALSS